MRAGRGGKGEGMSWPSYLQQCHISTIGRFRSEIIFFKIRWQVSNIPSIIVWFLTSILHYISYLSIDELSTVPVCSIITWEKVFQGCRILFVPRPRDCPGVPPSWNWFRVGISQCSKMLTVLTVLTEPWVCCSAHRCSRGHPPTLSLTAWIGHSAVRQQRWDSSRGTE